MCTVLLENSRHIVSICWRHTILALSCQTLAIQVSTSVDHNICLIATDVTNL